MEVFMIEGVYGGVHDRGCLWRVFMEVFMIGGVLWRCSL